MSMRVDKLIAILIYFLIIVELIYLYKNPLAGYTLSLYEGVEVVIIFNVLIFIISIFFLLYLKNNRIIELVFIISIFMCLSIILMLPYIRGIRVTNGGDSLVHVGITLDIIRTGRIDSYHNPYPLLHIYVASISIISGIFPDKMLSLFNPLVSILLYPLLTYTLSTRLFNTKIGIYSFMLAFLLPLNYFQAHYQSFTTPNGLAYMLLPLYFWIVYKIMYYDSIKLYILYILIVSSMSILHPLANVIVLITLFIYILILFFINEKIKNIYTIFLIHLVIFLSYLIYLTSVWKIPISNLNRLISGIIIVERTADIEGFIRKLGLNYLDIIEVGVRVAGHQGFMLILALLGIFASKKKSRNNYILLFKIFYSINFLFFIAQLIFPPLTNIPYYRYLLAMLGLSPIFAPIYILKKAKKCSKHIILAFLSVSFISSSLVAYPAPYSLWASGHATLSDYSIAGFISKYSDLNNIKLYGYYTKNIVGRYFLFYQSLEEYSKYRYKTWDGNKFILFDHFKYNISTMDSSYSYIVTSIRDFLAYTTVWKNLERLSWGDLPRLNSDYNLDLIYNNNDSRLFRLSAGLSRQQ